MNARIVRIVFGAAFLLMAIPAQALEQLTVTSSAFDDHGEIPPRFTCDGPGITPQLEWSAGSARLGSYMIDVEDIDGGSGPVLHWLVYNIGPAVTSLKEDASSSGSDAASVIQGLNEDGAAHYKPPCPGSGSHRYVFTVYALNILLPLKNGATRDQVMAAAKDHMLASGALNGFYARGKQ